MHYTRNKGYFNETYSISKDQLYLMFATMPITDIVKDRKVYLEIVSRALSGFPVGVTAKEVIEGYSLFFRVFFGEYETNFYIPMHGEFVYYEKEEQIIQRASRTQIIQEYERFLKLAERNHDDDY